MMPYTYPIDHLPDAPTPGDCARDEALAAFWTHDPRLIAESGLDELWTDDMGNGVIRGEDYEIIGWWHVVEVTWEQMEQERGM
jgi:hypothetical protein